MVTAAEAAAALGIDARTVREKLASGEWKGEKRMIGMKEKWFMFRGELDRQLERLRIIRPEERVSTQGLENVFDETEISDLETIDVNPSPGGTILETKAVAADLQVFVHECMKPLLEEVKQQAIALAEKDKIIEEQKAQLLLLPDFEMQKMQLLKRIDAEREAAEIHLAKVAEQEELAQILVKDVEKFRLEAEEAQKKAEDAALSLQKLQLLENQIEQLRQPWWKKWFTPST